MARKSYVNQIDPAEVSIAVEQILIADYPQSWTPARIDLAAPPTGFRHLGAVVEDTPVIRMGREKFKLETGLPRVLQYQAINAINAQFEAKLHSNHWRKVQYGLGNYTALSSATFVSTIASVTADQSAFTMVTTTTSIAAGRQIIVAPIGGVDYADSLEVRIYTFTNNWTVGLNAVYPRSIGVGWGVYYYDRVSQPLGGNGIKYFKLLGVADFLDNVQVIHELGKVSAADNWEEMFRPDQNGQVNLLFDALGYKDTINSCDQLIVGYRHYFPATDNLCTQ